MSLDACIKVCRAYDTNALLGPVRGTGDMYDLGGLTFLKRESVPVVVDHDEGKPVGEVHELVAWNFTDGRWIVARARLDAPPGWIRRGTPASFSSRPLQTSEINGWRIITRALIDEITIVSSTHRAVEPSAAVVLLKGTTSTSSVGEVSYGGTIIRRNIGHVLGVR